MNNRVLPIREVMDMSFVPIHMIGDDVELIHWIGVDIDYKFDGNYHRYKTGDRRQCTLCGGWETFRPYPFWVAMTEQDRKEGNAIMVGFWTVCRCKFEQHKKEYEQKQEARKQYAKHEKGKESNY